MANCLFYAYILYGKLLIFIYIFILQKYLVYNHMLKFINKMEIKCQKD